MAARVPTAAICAVQTHESIVRRLPGMPRSFFRFRSTPFLSMVRLGRRDRPLQVKLSLSSISIISRYLAGVALWALPLPAAAQPSTHLALTWSAPAGCPTEADVQARVASLLGGEAATSGVADVRANGQIARSGAAYRLQLSMSAGNLSSSRVLEAGSCDELAGAAAISLALLARSGSAEPSATGTTPTSDSAPPPSEVAPPAEERRPTVSPPKAAAEDGQGARRAAEANPSALHFVLHAPLVVVGRGTLPSLGVGLGAAAGIRYRALRVVAGGELWKEQQRAQLGAETRFTLQSARLDACLTQSLGLLDLGPCAGVAGERLEGEGLASETFSPRSARSLWLSGTGGVLASLQVPGTTFWRVVTQATVRVPATRTRFVIDQLGAVHQPSVAALKLDFGCEWIF
jgi:hypothetical protein